MSRTSPIVIGSRSFDGENQREKSFLVYLFVYHILCHDLSENEFAR